MRLLDCGSGPGTITLDLAEIVSPGEVVGIDIRSTQVDAGVRLARARAMVNARFQTCNVYNLPFSDASFDAVFANQLLFHLNEPLRAVMEMRRVLKADGVIGVRDSDEAGSILVPSTRLLEEMRLLRLRLIRHNGGDPFRARHHRQLLRSAGFVRVEAQAQINGQGTTELTRQWAKTAIMRLQGEAMEGAAIAQGWTTRERMDAMFTEMRAWGDRADAFCTEMFCSAVGRVAD